MSAPMHDWPMVGVAVVVGVCVWGGAGFGDTAMVPVSSVVGGAAAVAGTELLGVVEAEAYTVTVLRGGRHDTSDGRMVRSWR